MVPWAGVGELAKGNSAKGKAVKYTLSPQPPGPCCVFSHVLVDRITVKDFGQKNTHN